MNLLFLSPHFPAHYRLFCSALREQGVRVLGLGDSHSSALTPEVRQALDAYHFIKNLDDREAALRSTAALIAEYGRIEVIESLNEHWLPIEASLREDFNVPGPRPSEVEAWRSKLAMASAFEAAGLCPPRTLAVNASSDADQLIGELGLPLVLKPDQGVGATDTFVARSKSELCDILPRLDGATVAQPYVEGVLTSFDGLVDANGDLLVQSSFIYSDGVLELVRDRKDVVYYTRVTLPKALVATGSAMVRAFDLRSRFFHAELFEKEDGSFVPLEINVRPPGGFSTHLMNYGADYDVYRAWASVITGSRPAPHERRYHAAHVARRPNVSYRHAHQAILERLGPALMFVADLPPLIAAAMGSPVYVIRHEQEDELLRLSSFICERV